MSFLGTRAKAGGGCHGDEASKGGSLSYSLGSCAQVAHPVDQVGSLTTPVFCFTSVPLLSICNVPWMCSFGGGCTGQESREAR